MLEAKISQELLHVGVTLHPLLKGPCHITLAELNHIVSSFDTIPEITFNSKPPFPEHKVFDFELFFFANFKSLDHSMHQTLIMVFDTLKG